MERVAGPGPIDRQAQMRKALDAYKAKQAASPSPIVPGSDADKILRDQIARDHGVSLKDFESELTKYEHAGPLSDHDLDDIHKAVLDRQAKLKADAKLLEPSKLEGPAKAEHPVDAQQPDAGQQPDASQPPVAAAPDQAGGPDAKGSLGTAKKTLSAIEKHDKALKDLRNAHNHIKEAPGKIKDALVNNPAPAPKADTPATQPAGGAPPPAAKAPQEPATAPTAKPPQEPAAGPTTKPSAPSEPEGSTAAPSAPKEKTALQQTGRAVTVVSSAVNLAHAVSDLAKAVKAGDWPAAGKAALDLAKAVEGLAGEMADKFPAIKKLLGVAGGLGSLIGGIQGTAKSIEDMAKNGASVSNILGLMSGLTNSVGGVLSTIGMVPGAQEVLAVGKALGIVGGVIDAAKWAWDNKEKIAEKTSQAYHATADFANKTYDRASKAAEEAQQKFNHAMSEALHWFQQQQLPEPSAAHAPLPAF